VVEAVDVSKSEISVVDLIKEMEEGEIVELSVSQRSIVFVSSQQPWAASTIDEEQESHSVTEEEWFTVVSGKHISKKHEPGKDLENLDNTGNNFTGIIGNLSSSNLNFGEFSCSQLITHSERCQAKQDKNVTVNLHCIVNYNFLPESVKFKDSQTVP
jgi:hypothetical protein